MVNMEHWHMIGKMISHYRIIEELGRGGMGVVYKAEDTRLKRFVAIKSLPHHIAAGDEEHERFKIEAQAAAALNHPNIATIYSVEEVDGETFIVMECIEGRELRSFFKGEDRSPLPIDQVVAYATQIAEGLRAAHEKGVVHRDIKSGNIMITSAGHVKIMDFGLAKIRGTALVTRSGSTLGTAAYMSPEQARSEDVDQRTDIWSLGVVIYEMLTAQLPFLGDFEQAVIHSVLNDVPKPVSALRNDIPEKLREVVHRALAKGLTERYHTMDEVLQDLKPLQPAGMASGQAVTLRTLVRKPAFLIPIILVILALGGWIGWWSYNTARTDLARRELLPQIEALVADAPWTAEGPRPWMAFDLGEQVKGIVPDDPRFTSLQPKFSRRVRIESEPAGARVYARPYGDSTHAWHYFGTTPVQGVGFPIGFSAAKLEAENCRTSYDLVWNVSFLSDTIRFALPRIGTVPEGMELIAMSASGFDVSAAPAGLHMPGLEQVPPVNVGDFLMDRHEVTNAAYKSFTDAGGYRNRAYWKYPFVSNGRELSWDEAMKLFTDKTGQAGPSTWEAGSFTKGEEEYPVTGLSWFEAAAYCAFAGKSLPTIYHWDRVAFTWASPEIVPLSNLSGKGPMAVVRSKSMSRFGTYDLAGNAREWCFNESSRGGRFILGGGWNDAAYSFNDAYAQSAFDRTETNGFRCIKALSQTENAAGAEKTIQLPFRDFLAEKPVGDATYRLFLNQYSYDRTPLNAVIEETKVSEEWTRQKISFTAAYGKERMIAYLFLPKHAAPPYQTVIYFPGSGAIHTRSSESLDPGQRDFLVSSGRAFLFPIYKSTYERGDDLTSDYPDETIFWKDHVIMWVKDLSRSIDYLETRNDIDARKIAYFGASWGGAMGAIVPAVENRINVSVLLVAGMLFQRSRPEADQINFLQHIKTPVLMLNGKYDFFFPYETAQVPFFKLLGTPKDQKKLFVYDRGHTVPRTEMIKESLAWLDRFLGPVAR